MKRAILLSAVLLAGCAPVLKGGSEAGGIIKHAAREGASFQLATEHCAKYGKVARVSGQNVWESNMTFDCVPKQ